MAVVGPRPTVQEQVDRYTRAPAPPARGQAGHHRLGAGQRPHVTAVAGADRAGRLVRGAPLAAARPAHPGAHGADAGHGPRAVLGRPEAGLVSVSAPAGSPAGRAPVRVRRPTSPPPRSGRTPGTPARTRSRSGPRGPARRASRPFGSARAPAAGAPGAPSACAARRVPATAHPHARAARGWPGRRSSITGRSRSSSRAEVAPAARRCPGKRSRTYMRLRGCSSPANVPSAAVVSSSRTVTQRPSALVCTSTDAPGSASAVRPRQQPGDRHRLAVVDRVVARARRSRGRSRLGGAPTRSPPSRAARRAAA